MSGLKDWSSGDFQTYYVNNYQNSKIRYNTFHKWKFHSHGNFLDISPYLFLCVSLFWVMCVSLGGWGKGFGTELRYIGWIFLVPNLGYNIIGFMSASFKVVIFSFQSCQAIVNVGKTTLWSARIYFISCKRIACLFLFHG